MHAGVRKPDIAHTALGIFHFITIDFAEMNIFRKFVVKLALNCTATASDAVFLTENKAFLQRVLGHIKTLLGYKLFC